MITLFATMVSRKVGGDVDVALVHVRVPLGIALGLGILASAM
ncbi:hypothetical protein [Acidisphaera sp. S103]|nr:hypothetical protein [Acidisphaera sp. S103]